MQQGTPTTGRLMMIDSDAKPFRELLEAVLSGYAGDRFSLSAGVLRWWWTTLKPYPFAAIERGFSVHGRISRYSPKPADIIDFINQHDGRLSADEAWAQVIKASDENVSMMWTDEMREAWFHCKPVFDSGDEIGARMAFRQHYSRLLDAARLQGRPVKYEISLGFDLDSRKQVVERAVAIGVIGMDERVKLLPDDGVDALRIGHDGSLEASDSAPSAFRQRFQQILDEQNALSAEKAMQEQMKKEALKKAEEDRRELLMRQAGILEGEQ